MSNIREKLKILEKDKIKQKWENLDTQKGLTTKEKLEKLVNLNLKREKISTHSIPQTETDYNITPEEKNESFIITREFTYPLNVSYGKITLSDWRSINSQQLVILFGDDGIEIADPIRLVFFDTETTGLAGGTGTIPFMLGFGYFDETVFRVKNFILNDLGKEDEFLEEIDRFIADKNFSGVVTYNGKSFDFPLMESRYILQRRRFPLLHLPHLDFLFTARTLWRYTFDSRKLGILGEILLGLSREDDIEGSQIPPIYFYYLRSRSFNALNKVVEHNALDLLGLAGLIILAVKYQDNTDIMQDEGEILGMARLFEKSGDISKAGELYEVLKQSAIRTQILEKAVKGLAAIKKKKKLFQEASELLEMVIHSTDHRTVKELSIYFEHHEKNYSRALEYVRRALEEVPLTDAQRNDFDKRMVRLERKMKSLEKVDDSLDK